MQALAVLLAFNSLSRDHQMWDSVLLTTRNSAAFNSLSRDHFFAMGLEGIQFSLTFNSLSRDHAHHAAT